MPRKLGAVAATAAVGVAVAVVPSQAASSKTVVGEEQLLLPDLGQRQQGRARSSGSGRRAASRTTSRPPSGGSGSKTSSKKGYTFTKTFTKAGTFRYVCTIHSSMKMIGQGLLTQGVDLCLRREDRVRGHGQTVAQLQPPLPARR